MKHEITAKRLKKALDQAGLKPYQLADKSGVSQASISQYLNGSHKPSNISSGKMAEVLNVSPVWLMGFDVPQDDIKIKDYTSEFANAFSEYTKLADNMEPITIGEKTGVVGFITAEDRQTKNHLEYEMLRRYRELNDEGQNKLLNYADDLLESSKYRKNSGDVE